MSKLSAYNYYQNNTTATTGNTVPAAATATVSGATGTAPAAVVEISSAARQASAPTALQHSTNTIWGSAPRL